MSRSLEADVDPQCNVDVILDCLSADPESHKRECEMEWWEVQGMGERASWRLADLLPESDATAFFLGVTLPLLYAADPLVRMDFDEMRP